MVVVPCYHCDAVNANHIAIPETANFSRKLYVFTAKDMSYGAY